MGVCAEHALNSVQLDLTRGSTTSDHTHGYNQTCIQIQTTPNYVHTYSIELYQTQSDVHADIMQIQLDCTNDTQT